MGSLPQKISKFWNSFGAFWRMFRRIFRQNGDIVRSKNRMLVSVIVQKLTLLCRVVP